MHTHYLSGRRAVVLMFAIFAFCTWLAQTAPSHADISTSTMSSLPGMNALPDVGDVFGTVRRLSALTVTAGASAAASSTGPGVPDVPNIFPDIAGLLAGAASSTATSTGGLGSSITGMVNGVVGSSSTSGLGAQIAAAITGGASGTSNIGPSIKCDLLSGIGWPIPAFSSECNASTSTPQGSARIILIKHTIGFTIAGVSNGTTSIETSVGTGTIQLLVRPGTISITEDAATGWTQTSRGCVSSSSATSTGTVSGALGWSIGIAANDVVTCTFENSVSTTTPGGGGGCVDNCGGSTGGGGCVDNCGGGGNPGSGSSNGGGSTGGGGSNGPILGGGGFSPGEVLGASTSALPGIPNTGAGGNAERTAVLLIVSLGVALAGAVRLRRVS